MEENGAGEGEQGWPGDKLLARLWHSLLPRGLAYVAGGGTASGLALLAASPGAIDVLLASGAFTYGVRHAIHRHQGYLEGDRPAERRLAGLVRLDAIVGACFSGGAAICITTTPPGWAVGAFLAALFLSVLLLSGGTVVAAGAADRPRGSEWVRATRLVAWLETVLRPHRRGFGRPLLFLIRKASPVREASCYIVCLLTAMVMVAAADVGTSIPGVRKFLGLGHAPTTKKSTAAPEPAPARGRVKSGTAGPASAVPPVTYAQACPAGATPGYGAPEPQADSLRNEWLGPMGVGALVAGCAEKATEEAPGTGIWLTEGHCAGALRSLGVATADGTSALMLEEVANFAATAASVGDLVGASERIKASTGDFQSVDTKAGVYVLARQRSSNGLVARRGTSATCQDLSDENARYTVVPPALVELWSRLIHVAWVWPRRVGPEQPGGRFEFRSDSPAMTPVATATCTSDFECVLYVDGQASSSNGDARAATLLRRYAPAPK